MDLRIMEIVIPQEYKTEIEESLKEHTVLDIWQETIEEKRVHIKILVPTEKSEPILDLLEKRFSMVEGFRIILVPVEASIPRPKPAEEPKPESVKLKLEKKPASKVIRVSREELYADVEKTIRLSWIFIVMVILSSIAASIGILGNNVIFIIGAMVIASVLGPLVVHILLSQKS